MTKTTSPSRATARDGAGSAADPRSPTPSEVVSVRLQALERLDYTALRCEWRRLYRVSAPPRISRDLLLLGVGWKINEQALGGLSAATRRHLAGLAQTLEPGGDVT